MLTLQKARKLLPKDYPITDEQLSAALADAYLVAEFAVDDFIQQEIEKQKSHDQK